MKTESSYGPGRSCISRSVSPPWCRRSWG